MKKGIFRFAEHTVEIQSIHSYVQEMCKAYQAEKPIEFVIETCQEDIEQEITNSKREAELLGIKKNTFNEGYLESLAVYRKLVKQLLSKRVILFHGSLISVDGKGYLFTAKSGTGKSTHTRLWRELFGERAVMVNDDKPLLRIEQDYVRAYGTPWDGKHGLSTNMSVQIKSICILERDVNNHIEAISPSEVFPMLMQQCYKPDSEEDMLQTMILLSQMTESVKFYRLGCNMEPEAAEIAWMGMQDISD